LLVIAQNNKIRTVHISQQYQHVYISSLTAVCCYLGHRTVPDFSHTRWHGTRGRQTVTDYVSCARNSVRHNSDVFKMNDIGVKDSL